MKHSRGRVLTIVSDCHSSGSWVRECAKFLDEQGVKPCGHSAREKGILLKVYASCQAGQDSTELAYTTRGMKQKNGTLSHYTDRDFSNQQHTFGVDFTRVMCGKGEEEKCRVASDATWSTAGELIAHPQSILKGKYQGYQHGMCIVYVLYRYYTTCFSVWC